MDFRRQSGWGETTAIHVNDLVVLNGKLVASCMHVRRVAGIHCEARDHGLSYCSCSERILVVCERWQLPRLHHSMITLWVVLPGVGDSGWVPRSRELAQEPMSVLG